MKLVTIILKLMRAQVYYHCDAVNELGGFPFFVLRCDRIFFDERTWAKATGEVALATGEVGEWIYGDKFFVTIIVQLSKIYRD